MPAQDNHRWDDHNLLIRLDQKVTDLQTAVKELNEGTVSKIASLEKDKADRKEVEALQKKVNEDIELRVEKLETWRTARMEQIMIEAKTFDFYFKVALGLGILIMGLIIWHLTGYRI